MPPHAGSRLTTAACPALRWRLGRNHWRHDRDEGFRPADYAVDGVPDRLARAFVQSEHYSGTYPFAQERIGLFRGQELVGVAIFSTPINGNALPLYAGTEAKAGLELGRFVLLDQVPYNGESYFLAAAMRLLRQARPELASVLAYSDPMPRMARDGSVVMPGHIGIAYQATNGRYVGRAASKSLYLTAGGQALSSRALSKIRLQEHGAGSAEKRLVHLGAPARQFGEDPRVWVERALNSGAFRQVRHPGNHVYVWSLERSSLKAGQSRRPAPARPYPKSLDADQRSLFAD